MTHAEKMRRWRYGRAARAVWAMRAQRFFEMPFGAIWQEFTGQPVTPQSALGNQHRREWMGTHGDDITNLSSSAAKRKRDREQGRQERQGRQEMEVLKTMAAGTGAGI